MDMDVWRIRPSGESPERLTTPRGREVPGAAQPAHAALRGARRGPVGTVAVGARRREQGDTPRDAGGVDQYTSVSASRDGRRVVATVANPTTHLWRVPLLDRLADDRDAQPYPLGADGAGAGPAVRPDVSVLFVHPRDGRRPLEGPGRTASEVWKGRGRALSEPPAVSPDGRRVAVVVRQEGKRHLAIMSADGTNARTLAASIEIEGAAGQGRRRLVAGRQMDRDRRQ